MHIKKKIQSNTVHVFIGGEGVRLNIADLLPKLAERIHCDKLHMVHRLDKETTGIMLFGK